MHFVRDLFWLFYKAEVTFFKPLFISCSSVFTKSRRCRNCTVRNRSFVAYQMFLFIPSLSNSLIQIHLDKDFWKWAFKTSKKNIELYYDKRMKHVLPITQLCLSIMKAIHSPERDFFFFSHIKNILSRIDLDDSRYSDHSF